MQSGISIGIFVLLAATCQLATGQSTYRLLSTTRNLFLRVAPDDGTLWVNGNEVTAQGG